MCVLTMRLPILTGHDATHGALLPGGQYARGQGFILVYRLAMDARPCGVMVGLTENIQACLRIFRRAQHLWLVRDILHQPQGVFIVFVL